MIVGLPLLVALFAATHAYIERLGALASARRTARPHIYPSFGIGLQRRARNAQKASGTNGVPPPVDGSIIVVDDENMDVDNGVFYIDNFDDEEDADQVTNDQSVQPIASANQPEALSNTAQIQAAINAAFLEATAATQATLLAGAQTDDEPEDGPETEEHYIEITDDPSEPVDGAEAGLSAFGNTAELSKLGLTGQSATGAIALHESRAVLDHAKTSSNGTGATGSSNATNAGADAAQYGGGIGAGNGAVSDMSSQGQAYYGTANGAYDMHAEPAEDSSISAPVIMDETPTETAASQPTATETSATSATTSALPEVKAHSNKAHTLAPSIYIGAAVLLTTLFLL